MSGPAGPSDAASRLQRLLHIIPAASREGGAAIAELAEQLGVSEATVAHDIGQVIEREYHLKAGNAGALQVEITQDRVEVFSPAAFARPVRLSPREALAVGIGLRMAALSPSGGEPERRESIRRRLETHLATRPADEGLEHFGAPDLGSDPDGIRETLALCARDRRACRIRYLKPGTPVEERPLHPYLLVHAEGRWYVLAFCETAEGVRAFRMDRVCGILEVGEEGDGFELPTDFDPAEWFDGGRVFLADREIEARVRYSPAVARAVAEQREGEWEEDGSLVVRHRVADVGWLVRHVLEAGGEAQVLEPSEVRAAVVEAARGVAETHG